RVIVGNDGAPAVGAEFDRNCHIGRRRLKVQSIKIIVAKRRASSNVFAKRNTPDESGKFLTKAFSFAPHNTTAPTGL
ncbi:MAG TPA: hypothetical protein PKL15_14690, partial [Saprospiraceae bacterium]|nr:hypothetical protein [Saprospiraceae bacterium]